MNLSSPLLSESLKLKIQEKPLLTVLQDSQKKPQDFEPVMICPEIDVPDEFDGKKIWKDFLSPVFNQGKCGSCWAFASTSVLSNRFNLFAQGQMNLILSPSKLVICDFQGRQITKKDEIYHFPHPESDADRVDLLEQNYQSHATRGCYGNTLKDAWRYLYLFGSTSIECVPYDVKVHNIQNPRALSVESGYGKVLDDKSRLFEFSLSQFQSGESIPNCQNVSGPINDMCYNNYIGDYHDPSLGTPARFWRCITYYRVPGTGKFGPINIQREIYLHGPITTGMRVYPNFYTFDPRKEIYTWDNRGPQVGGHAIEIVGWGRDNGTDFWWVKNSWGTDWGIDGYFKIARGTNECGIEENVVTGFPDFFTVKKYSVKEYLKGVPEEQRERNIIDYGEPGQQVSGGGIDPTNGFTRRAMGKYPGINYSLDGILDVDLVDVNKPAYQITGPRYNLGTHAFFGRDGRSRFQAISGGIVDTVTNWIFVVLCSIIVILSVYIAAKRS